MNDPLLRRQTKYNKHQHIENLKKSSEEFSISLRKKKRIDTLKKMRSQAANEDNEEDLSIYIGIIPESLLNSFPELQSAKTETEKLRIFADILKYPEIPEVFILEILKILTDQISCLSSLPIRQYYINFGIHSILIDFIETSEDYSLLSQSIWCLANLMAGPENYSEIILHSQVIDRLLKLLGLGDPEIFENIGYLLGNISIENPEICKTLIEKRYYHYINSIEIMSPSLASSVSYSLSSITSHNNLLSLIDCANILSIYDSIFDLSPLSCMAGLHNLTKSDKEKMTLFISSKSSLKIFQFLEKSPNFCNASLKIIANLSSGHSEHELFLIENKVLDIFHTILKQVSNENLALLYFSLSNLVSGRNERSIIVATHEIINEHEFVFSSKNEEVLKEVTTFYKNLTSISSKYTKQKLIEDGIFYLILPHLESPHQIIVTNILHTIKSLLVSQPFLEEDIVKIFEETGCRNATEKLVYGPNQDISDLAISIITSYP